jgi:hypothetical protein
MKIVIVQNDGVVGVDGAFRSVDLSGLDAAIRVIHFDTIKGSGHIEYDPEATIDVEDRDHEAEAAEVAACAGDQVALNSLQPIYRMFPRRRAPLAISSIANFQVFVDRWVAAAPPPPTAEELADRERVASIETAIVDATYGTVQPATRAQLKAMTNQQITDWFNANFTTQAQLVGLLRLLTRIIIRRVL